MTTLISLIMVATGLLLFARFWRSLEHTLRLNELFPAFVLIIHGTGFLLAKYFLSREEYGFLLGDLQISEADISIAFYWIISGCIFALYFSHIFRGSLAIRSLALRSSTDRFIHSPAFNLCITGVLLAEVYLIFAGYYGIGGILSNEETNQVSPVALLLPPLVDGLLYVSGYLIGYRKRRSVAAFLLATQLFYLFLGGRRALFIGLMATFIGLRLTGFSFTRTSPIRNLLAGIFAIMIFSLAFPFFLAIRNEKLGDAGSAQALTTAFANGYNRMTRQTASESDFKTGTQYNALSRPFYIGYPAMLFKYGAGSSGTHGQILVEAIKRSIPQLLWKGKAAYLQSETSEEYFAYVAFQLPRFQDESNTIFTSGYTELKYAGIPIYIFLMYFVVGISIRLAIRTGSDVYIMYMIFYILSLFVTIELTTSDILLLFRNSVLILSPILLFYQRFFRKRAGLPPTPRASRVMRMRAGRSGA